MTQVTSVMVVVTHISLMCKRNSRKVCYVDCALLKGLLEIFISNFYILSSFTGASSDHIPQEGERWNKLAVCCTSDRTGLRTCKGKFHINIFGKCVR